MGPKSQANYLFLDFKLALGLMETTLHNIIRVTSRGKEFSRYQWRHLGVLGWAIANPKDLSLIKKKKKI